MKLCGWRLPPSVPNYVYRKGFQSNYMTVRDYKVG